MTITNKVSNKTLMPGITPVADVIDAPTIGTATDSGDGTTASVPFTASATGGAATTFTAVSTPSSITATSATSPISVTGLTAGTAYTFNVYGTNASGTWSANQSSASNSLTLASPEAYYPIQSYVVPSGGAATITFSSIPNTYTHLQIRGIVRSSYPSVQPSLALQINGGWGLKNHSLYGDGASASPYAGAGVNFSHSTGNSAGASMYSSIVIDILDYADTNKYKTIRALSGGDRNGSGFIELVSSLKDTTSAVTSVALIETDPSYVLTQYSHFALYGIKG